MTPRHILWSPDGKRLRFDLEDQKNATFSIWELTLSDQDRSQVSSLIPLHAPLKDCWSPSLTLDGSGRSFVTGGRCGAEGIYLLEEHQEFWNSRFDFLEMNPMVHNIANLALDKNSSKVFAVGEYAGPQRVEEAEHLDLIKFNVRSQEFRPFLPGLNASYVDFTRNGTMIAYVRLPEQTLWISRPDGSGARQIELQTNHLELPRWSPDGRSLAFMAQTQGKPWRILVVSANGGKPKEASSGTDNQGAPTWSPDGKWLVYGNVECQEAKTCAIHRIDLSSGRVDTVPNSEGLGTARWSPDGKFIAALSPTEHDVRVFDLASQQWRKLVDGVNGNDLNWSVDSRYLYASRSAGGHPEILRVSLADSTAETEVDLRSFAVLTGHIGTWFTLAPDGSIVFFREMSGNEVYSMTYAEK